MPSLIPVKSIHVHRDGKLVVPTIGKPFEFTDSEVSDITSLMPEAVREAVNEMPAPVAAPAPAPAPAAKKVVTSDL